MVPPVRNLANPPDVCFAPILECQCWYVTANNIDKMEDHNSKSYKLPVVIG